MKKENRLYQIPVPVIGLTGGIASGKSTVSQIYRNEGLPVICADQLIKKIYSFQETKNWLKNLNPQYLNNDFIDFDRLRQDFYQNSELKEKIEGYLYSKLEKAFWEDFESFKDPQFIIYDVPLLFEKNLVSKLDTVILVYCPEAKQIKRLKGRESLSEIQIEQILSHQISIDEKRKSAPFIIDNSEDFDIKDSSQLKINALVILENAKKVLS
ncbi:MAG: dephospho-CoA kinase [Halobacteriovoraceae bacterium]|nr:dephospho-CoA kinase [Halobacteriovoraceae bacterium]MCB9095490.1 dephospho-CoA kinase [Halobacteriovoraceae bacterium]